MKRRIALALALLSVAGLAYSGGSFVDQFNGMILGRWNTTTGFLRLLRAEHGYDTNIRAATGLSGTVDLVAPSSSGTLARTTDNVSTATALAANPTNCPAGEAPRGVDASGDAENCTAYQTADADLTTYAGITPSSNVQSILAAANYSAIRTLLALVPGTDVQAYDADLLTYAGITPSANVQSLLGAADYAAIRTQLSLLPGTDVQAYSAKLAALDALTWAADKIPYFTGAGAVSTADLSSAFRTFLATSSSANLRGVLTDETGSGLAVFADSPTITTPTFSGAIDQTGVSGSAVAAIFRNGTSSGDILRGYDNTALSFGVHDDGRAWFGNTETGASAAWAILTLSRYSDSSPAGGLGGANVSQEYLHLHNGYATGMAAIGFGYVTGSSSLSPLQFGGADATANGNTAMDFFVRARERSGSTYYDKIWVHGDPRALTESSATTVAAFDIESGGWGSAEIDVIIVAADGSPNIQTRTAHLRLTVRNISSTEVCTVTRPDSTAATNETDDWNSANISTGTLTYAWTCSTSPTDGVLLQVNAVSSLTQTTLNAYWQANLLGKLVVNKANVQVN